tara:strand:+ start:34 stop:2613 length:2580 start_codon:yes stop_codon:yes gene_type:complete
MSLELSIFKRLLKEAILSQTEFLDKVSQTYTDRERLPDDKILARLLELIDETQILSLTGKANKKNRKKVENFIDDQVKAMTAEDGTSVSIRDIRKLYDGIIKYLAPDVSGKRKSDVSFDQCIRYADMFLKTIYPNLSADQKASVDSGDFPYDKVFRLVLDSQKLSGDRPVKVDVIYEDEIIKIVYPLDAYSFITYVNNNLPDIPWKDVWCTMTPSTWSNYHKSKFLSVAYVKSHYKQDHSLSLISLKTNIDGDILYDDTCDYYNIAMDDEEETLKQYLSEECIEKIKVYFLNIKSSIKENVLEAARSFESLGRLENVEELNSKLVYMNSYKHIVDEIDGLEKKIEKYLSSLPKEFLNKVVVEFVSNVDVYSYLGDTPFSKYMGDLLSESFTNDGEIWNILYQKALKRNLNPRYANAFIDYVSSYKLNIYYVSKTSEFKIRRSLKEGEGSIIFANACNSNNPEFFKKFVEIYTTFESNKLVSKEDLNSSINKIFLSKSFISFYKENLDSIKELSGEGSSFHFIVKHIKEFEDCHEEISKRAGTESVDIKKIVEKGSLLSIISESFKFFDKITTGAAYASSVDIKVLYEKLVDLTLAHNRKLNTNVTISNIFKALLEYEDAFIHNWVFAASIVANNDKEVESKDLKSIIERSIVYMTKCVKISVAADSVYNKYLDVFVQLIQLKGNVDAYRKLTNNVVEEIRKLEIFNFLPDIYMTLLGVNEDFTEIDIISKNSFNYLFKIPGLKKTVQTSFIADNHRLIFNYIFDKYESKELFDSQIKFISENFKSATFINLLREYFNEYENNINYMEKSQRNDKASLEYFANQKEIVRIPLKKYLGIEIFSEDQEEPEELVRDYVKTQL